MSHLDDITISDEMIVKKIKSSHDKEALNTLLFRYERSAKSLVKTRLYHLNKRGYDEDEFLQLIRYATIKATETYDAKKGKFYPYWYRVADRVICSELRRIHNKTNSLEINQSFLLKDEEDTDWFENIDPRHASINQQLYAEERLAKIREASDLFLDVIEKVVLSYRIAGYSYEEIAKKIKSTPKGVDNIVFQIRRKLKDYL